MVGRSRCNEKRRVVLPPGLDFTPDANSAPPAHVRQCRAGFWPAARFQATVRLTHRRSAGMRFAAFFSKASTIPRSVRLASECHRRLDRFHRIIKLFERLQQLHVRTRGFEVMTSASSAAIESMMSLNSQYTCECGFVCHLSPRRR